MEIILPRLVLIFFIFYSTSLFSLESENKILSLNRTYIALGNRATPLKLEFAFRQRLFEESQLFIGYHQKTLWDINKDSSPILDTNYNPHLFYDLGECKEIYWTLGIFEHLSNGEEGNLSRGTNMSFINTYKIFFTQIAKIEISSKFFLTYKTDSASPDLNEYMGTWSLMTKISNFLPIIKNYHAVEFRLNPGGRYGTKFNKGHQEVNLFYQPSEKALHTFFAQFFTGKNESLIDYKTYHRSIRLGLSLTF
jgi:outer membrane phospholipase A